MKNLKIILFLIVFTILGFANAGQPLALAEEERLGTLRVDEALLPKNSEVFALQIKGDSMNSRRVNSVAINDGSFVIIQKTPDVNNGDVVLALIDDAATIKTFKKSSDLITLYPESTNPTHTPIYLDSSKESIINGKVIMALENPR